MNRYVSVKCLVFSRWLRFPAIALFFLTGGCVDADPVGDFMKKVGHSISKAFQPQPAPSPAKNKQKRAPRRLGSTDAKIVDATPTPIEQPTVIAKEEKITPATTLIRASAAPPERAKGDMPYGIPVPGQKGMVTSPYLPEGGYIDVSGFPPGSAVKDPYTGKIFLVP